MKPPSRPARPATPCWAASTRRMQRTGGQWIITADHGNAETMIDPTNGGPHTYHTTNPVPLILVNEARRPLRSWRLASRPRAHHPRSVRLTEACRDVWRGPASLNLEQPSHSPNTPSPLQILRNLPQLLRSRAVDLQPGGEQALLVWPRLVPGLRVRCHPSQRSPDPFPPSRTSSATSSPKCTGTRAAAAPSGTAFLSTALLTGAGHADRCNLPPAPGLDRNQAAFESHLRLPAAPGGGKPDRLLVRRVRQRVRAGEDEGADRRQNALWMRTISPPPPWGSSIDTVIVMTIAFWGRIDGQMIRDLIVTGYLAQSGL
jgi:hypothetical protein